MDQKPSAAGFLDHGAPPYSLDLWVLLGLIGAFVITQVLNLWTGSPMGLREKVHQPPQEPGGVEEPLLLIGLE